MRARFVALPCLILLASVIAHAGDDAARINRQLMAAYREAYAQMTAAHAWAAGTQKGFAVTPATPSARLAPPANDNFANRRTIAGSSGSEGGTTVDATFEPGEPFHPYWIGHSNSIWFTWTAPASGAYCFNLSGSAATCVIGIFTNTSLATLRMVHDRYMNRVSIDAVAGQAYQIVVVGAGPTPSGLVTLNFYRETLSAWLKINAVTNMRGACHATKNGTVMVVPQTTCFNTYFKSNQFNVITRVSAASIHRSLGLHVIDRHGTYLVSNAVPPGLSAFYYVGGFDGRQVLVYDHLTYRLVLYRIRRGTLEQVGEQSVPNFYTCVLGSRDIVVLQIHFGDNGSTRYRMGVRVYDNRLASLRWESPLAPGDLIQAYSARGISARSELLPTTMAMTVSSGNEMLYQLALPYPANRYFSSACGGRGESIVWTVNGSFVAPTNYPISLYGRDGSLVAENITLDGAGTSWHAHEFDGRNLLVSSFPDGAAATLYLYRLGTRVSTIGSATVNNFNYAAMVDRTPVAFTYTRFITDLYGAQVYNGTLRREQWHVLPSPGDLALIAKNVMVRTADTPAGDRTNFYYRIANPRGIIVTNTISY